MKERFNIFYTNIRGQVGLVPLLISGDLRDSGYMEESSKISIFVSLRGTSKHFSRNGVIK